MEKVFLDMPIKNGEETYKQIIEMEKNNDYTTGNLLDYEYFSKHYKLIAIDLSKQIELENPDLKLKMDIQKIANFLGDADNESSKFATRNWYVINDQNNTDYGK